MFFRVDEDPEIVDTLIETISKRIKTFTTEQLLTTIVNITHTLSSSALELMILINEEFAERLSENFNPKERDLYIVPDDLVKIANTMVDLNYMTDNLKQQMIDHIQE